MKMSPISVNSYFQPALIIAISPFRSRLTLKYNWYNLQESIFLVILETHFLPINKNS